MNNLVIETKGICRDFVNGDLVVHALKNVDFRVEKGEFAAVAGPSGSGKTTLFNVIGGLDSPTSGQVKVGGIDIGEVSGATLSKIRLEQIGFVFQAYNLIPVLTAFENVEYPLLLKKVPEKDRKERTEELLLAVGLADMMHRRPSQLSGGQQQRVAVARSLVCDPAVVLADEPTANLDSKSGEKLMSLMEELNRTKSTTFLFSTHDPMVMKESRRLVRLKDGQIVSDEINS